MKGPDVQTVVKDEKRNITYVILAYRKLTELEVRDAIASVHASLKKKRRKVEPGKRYTVETQYR